MNRPRDAAAPAETGTASNTQSIYVNDTTHKQGAQAPAQVDLTAIRERLREQVRRRGGNGRRARRDDSDDSASAPPPPPRSDDPRPTIMTTARLLDEVRRDALAALEAAEERDRTLYVRRDALMRLRLDPEEGARIELVSKDAMRGRLAEVAVWLRRDGEGGDVPCAPPEMVAADILALPSWPFPPIRRVARTPLLAPDGRIVSTPGYHPDLRVYLDLDDGLRGIAEIVPERPTRADAEAAVTLILDGWLGDFPFADEAARAHALALLLTLIVRDLIPGPVPLHVIDAPQPGTGKSLLVSAIALAATGRLPAAMTEGRDDEEWRKRITASLLPSPAMVMIDNVRARLDSGALSALLTTTTWEDRVLGQTRMISLPATAVWVSTGNNITLSNELARRSVVARLDARCEQPWRREGFHHPEILAWTREQRPVLLAAALTLCRAWVAEGMPRGSQTLGSYEDWARVVGGVLDVAGVLGLLGNVEQVYDAADAERREWRALVEAWWKAHGRRPATVGDIRALIEGTDLLLGLRANRSDAGIMRALGVALSRNRDRVYRGLRIVDAGRDSHRGAARYALVPVGPDAPPEPDDATLPSPNDAALSIF